PCALVICAARRFPSARDGMHLAVGVGWYVVLTGWEWAAFLLLLSVLVHRLAHRASGHFAMLAVGLACFAAARVGPLPHTAAWLTRIHGSCNSYFHAFCCVRLAFFAFEA